MIKKAESSDPKVVFEDVGGLYGFRCRYEHNDEGVGVVVWQIVGRQPDGMRLALFAREKEGEVTPDHIAAPPYLTGAIKADGPIWMESNAVFVGAIGMKKDFAVRKHIFMKCYELLELDGEKAWKHEP